MADMTNTRYGEIRTNIYVDGFNLYYGALKKTPYRWLNLDALFKLLFPKNNILETKYFTARVSGRPNDPSGSFYYLIYK